jgi:poly(beta-D-mannuronate) lyase
MPKLFALTIVLLLSHQISAKKIWVKNSEELSAANASVRPGDTVVLKNGVWKDIVMKLNCVGTKQKPIVFIAQNQGEVIISGVSQLKLGGAFIVVDGLLFTRGYAPSKSVIEFRISDKELANNCRVTNCVVNDFNKPKRMDEDQWVSFYGKNNRLDHCSFFNKKNMGVLLAVMLDDERSRENFHSIDHNLFGIRPPLGSNGGEIIRVGVSQHATFNSNTQIRDNFFDECDGETEIVSIKSGGNVVDGNVFKECQGSVVLRHGDNNTVTNNLFLGNGKTATGGVRVINKGQWVINNFFYRCRGESFKAPIAIMNGIPNSPANRYVQVTDAVVMNNTFVDCTPVSFGEGSDAERTLPPSNVLFAKNIFYNESDTAIYRQWDDISGIRFSENKVSRTVDQQLPAGFAKTSFGTTKLDAIDVPTAGRGINRIGLDSLKQIDKERMPNILPAPGFSGHLLIKQLRSNAFENCGARWFKLQLVPRLLSEVRCNSAEEVYKALEKNSPVHIRLTKNYYQFSRPLHIRNNTLITSNMKQPVQLETTTSVPALFIIQSGELALRNLTISMESVLKVDAFVMSDTSGNSDHYSFRMENVTVNDSKGFKIFNGSKSTFADSIVIRNCFFRSPGDGFFFAEERDDKGYYNAERIVINNNSFQGGLGVLLNVYRGGNDESTLGPDLHFKNNKITDYNTPDGQALLQLTGVQKTSLTNNVFTRCNPSKPLVSYKDIVRARHFFKYNTLVESGQLQKNQFVTEERTGIR